MDPDILLLIGIGLVILSVPALLSAWADRRPPWIGLLVLAVGGGLGGYAAATKEGGYVPGDVPDIFFHLLARFLN